jgi:uncharacterized protein YbaA (DUF1428 family)
MSYIDGFVIAVPTANKLKFIEHARHFDSMFIELGAIRVIEGWGDDVPDGKVTDFRRAVQATASPTASSPISAARSRPRPRKRWRFRGSSGQTRPRATQA